MLMMSRGEQWVYAITKQLQEIARSKHKGNSLKSQKWKRVKGKKQWSLGAGLFMVDVSKKVTCQFPFFCSAFLPFLLLLSDIVDK